MIKLKAFLNLIRWPNLVFIGLTQVLFYFCIIVPTFNKYGVVPFANFTTLSLLLAASILIAAAGYIINDYFDVNIDKINKPQKLVIERHIKRRAAIQLHFIFSTIGVVLTLLFMFYTNFWVRTFSMFLIPMCNIAATILLLLYSTTYKKRFLIGNFLISILTAWTIFVLYFAELPSFLKVSNEYVTHYTSALLALFKLTVIYSAFAFVASIIREAVKDIEDMEGDKIYGCTTLPIKMGIPATKLYIAVWTVILIGAITAMQVYVAQLGWYLSILYSALALIAPLVYFLLQLFKAKTTTDFNKLSSIIKLVILLGILSMLFFKWYAN
jgi:4-hydroxybenzoate polyprenyltransferase